MVEKNIVRPSPIREIDPALTLSQDISKFIVDWVHISKVKKVDEIKVVIHGTEVSETDLQELLRRLAVLLPRVALQELRAGRNPGLRFRLVRVGAVGPVRALDQLQGRRLRLSSGIHIFSKPRCFLVGFQDQPRHD